PSRLLIFVRSRGKEPTLKFDSWKIAEFLRSAFQVNRQLHPQPRLHDRANCLRAEIALPHRLGLFLVSIRFADAAARSVSGPYPGRHAAPIFSKELLRQPSCSHGT